MEVVYKLFSDLESNNPHEVEESKKKFAETFSSTRDPIIVHGMMDYFSQTNSVRCVDVLVKVQAPHDRHIFDRLSDWIKGSNKLHALNLFGHIVIKHPTWLFIIANHQLMRDILKLLKTEKEILPLMGALLCIINLMPIIPSKISNYLNELFEVFAHLAAWNCQNPTKLTSDLLIHLQIGLYRFFHRLYGMFPCNFIEFLRQEYSTKEKAAIFMHTIKPLLYTVKMNPLLVTASANTEMKPDRWKKMEPHDVVFECSKFSLDYLERPDCQWHNYHSNRLIGAPIASIQTTDYCSTVVETSGALMQTFQRITITENNRLTGNSSNMIKPPHLKLPTNERFVDLSHYNENKIWSPSVVVLATPPPTGTVPHTPTPNSAIQTNYSTQIGGGNMASQDGSSPPEAAVEATPETTPLKNEHIKRALPSNSSAVRAIWGASIGTSGSVSSTPSSPMKKESPFHFPDNTHDMQSSSQKILRIMSDRNQSAPTKTQSPINGNSSNLTTTSSIPNSPVPVDNLNSAAVDSHVTSQEDQEVTEINKNQLNDEFAVDCDVDCYTKGSPCYAGGLHLPDSKSMFDLVARRVNRFRMYSNCIEDLNYSTSTSPNDINCDYFGNKRLIKKSTSWPDLSKLKQDCKNSLISNLNLPKITTSLAQSSDTRSSNNAANGTVNINQTPIAVTRLTIGTQTVEQYPQYYEQIFKGLFCNENRNNISAASLTVSDPTTTSGLNVMTPHELLENYIATSIKRKLSEDNRNWEDMYRDQIKLLNLQLQYERHRREIHAERNRRLLGKSRTNHSLELHNQTLHDQVSRLTKEITFLNGQSSQMRKKFNQTEQDLMNQINKLKFQLQAELEQNKNLTELVESTNKKLVEEQKTKKEVNLELESVRGELFDLRNDMRQALNQADLGQQYRNELTRLQSEMILMGEIQLKCKEKLSELNNLRARDMELETLKNCYAEELKELKSVRDIKSSHLDTAKGRIAELEAQLSRCEGKFTEQKRTWKAAKEEYQENIDAIESKYHAQKAIILRMEEHILELYKTQSAVNIPALSPEPDKTDIVGSLDHTSPLSSSLTSSDGLPGSVHSELKNLHAFVRKSSGSNFYNSNHENDGSGSGATNTNENISSYRGGAEGNNSGGLSGGGVSDDIPVPSSSHHHLPQFNQNQ